MNPMLFIKKYKFELLFGSILIILYFFLRLYHILSLPIFTDEAIYIRWSEIAKQDANWRFISLTDGKQPMFVWIAIVFLHIFHDPLLAVRLVSVFAGLGTTIGLFFLGKEIFQRKWIGLLSSALYVLYPFGLVYDRMAIYDSLVAMFAVWGWYITILLVRKVRSDIPFILGLVLGGGFLTKSSDFFIGALLPASLLLFNFTGKDVVRRLVQWLFYALIAIGLGLLYYSVLRLSPFYTIISEKNAIFVYPFKEWLQHPFTFFIGNIKGLFDWFITYTKVPLVFLIVGSFFFIKERFKEKLLVVIWFLVPFLYLAFFGRTLYPRFILFMTVALLPLAAYTVYKIHLQVKNIIITTVIFVALLFPNIQADYFIITNFAVAPIPKSDLTQYINDWPAGGGVREAITFFQQKAQLEHIYIGTEGTFGLMPYGLEIYLVQNPHIKIAGIWPITDTLPKSLADASKKVPTYVIFYQPCPSCRAPGEAPIQWPLTLIARYKKGIGNAYLSIYQVKK